MAVDGVVYLLCFDRPLGHARHYTGWTSNLEARLAAHAAGRGARLLAVVAEAGIGWRLVRTWAGDRHAERALKAQGGASRRCPACRERARRLASLDPLIRERLAGGWALSPAERRDIETRHHPVFDGGDPPAVVCGACAFTYRVGVTACPSRVFVEHGLPAALDTPPARRGVACGHAAGGVR